MAFFFTLLYLLTAYLTPWMLFGPLSDYHIEIIIVILAMVTSIPNVSQSGLSRAPQTVALGGLGLAIAASIAQSGWLGGAVGPVYGFMQPVLSFALVALNVKTRRHLQWITLCFIAGSVVFIVAGLLDLRANVFPSLYWYGSLDLRRLRGLGFVADPNDLSQMMVSLIPMVFLWRQKNAFLDFFLLGIPMAVLITGIYFTHSRGAMLALTVVILLSARRKIGALPAAIGAGCLLAGLMAVGWSGGRDVSMDAGADRLDLWYAGMEMIKAHPLFGVGLNRFADAMGITAHNSVVICASELGLVGLYFWVMLIFSSMRKAIRLGVEPARSAGIDNGEELNGVMNHRSKQNSVLSGGPARGQRATAVLEPPQEHKPAVYLPGQGSFADELVDRETDESIREMARLLLYAMAGFLTAGWFLSRALSMWLFMYCGMVFAISRMNGAARAIVPDKPGFVARWSAIVAVGLLLTLYIILRARNIGH